MKLSLTIPSTFDPNDDVLTVLSLDNAVKSKTTKKLNEVLSGIAANPFFIHNSIFPPAIRYIDFTSNIAIYERQPSVVRMNFSPDPAHKLSPTRASRHVFNLPLPWQRYAVHFGPTGIPDVILVFFSQNQIEDVFDSPCAIAPIPNLFHDAHLCMPVATSAPATSYDFIESISMMWNNIWESGFNVDTTAAISYWASHHADGNGRFLQEALNRSVSDMYYVWSRSSFQRIMSINWDKGAITRNIVQYMTDISAGLTSLRDSQDLFLSFYHASL